MMCSIWMLIISQHVAVRNRRSQQSCASGCSSLFYIAENSGSAACLARRMRRADAALRCQCSSFSSSLNTPWKLRSKMKIWNLFEELGIADKTNLNTFVNLNVRLSVACSTKDLWLQMDGIATKCDFPKYHYEVWPWYFKSNEDTITKF